MDIFIGDIFDCTKQEQHNFFYRLVFMIARVAFPVINSSHGPFLSMFCYVSRDTSCSRDFDFVFVL